MKSPNQIVFNPAARESTEHTDIREAHPPASAKKIVRKVKKSAPSGMSKSDVNTMAFTSTKVNMAGAKASQKNNNTTLQ